MLQHDNGFVEINKKEVEKAIKGSYHKNEYKWQKNKGFFSSDSEYEKRIELLEKTVVNLKTEQLELKSEINSLIEYYACHTPVVVQVEAEEFLRSNTPSPQPGFKSSDWLKKEKMQGSKIHPVTELNTSWVKTKSWRKTIVPT